MVPGHHVTRKRAAPFAFFFFVVVAGAAAASFSETHVNTNRQHSQQTQVVAAYIRQKRPDPENQMESCQAESGAPAAPGLSRWRQGWGHGSCKKQMNGGKLMDPISQQLSNEMQTDRKWAERRQTTNVSFLLTSTFHTFLI